MQELKMIDCPKCNEKFPEKRKMLGYHVCVNCSTAKPVVGITTIEGSGDHTYNDIIIMDQDRARAIANHAAELSGQKANLEVLDFDGDETAVSQSVKEKVHNVLHDDEDDVEDDVYDPNKKYDGVEGIDY